MKALQLELKQISKQNSLYSVTLYSEKNSMHPGVFPTFVQNMTPIEELLVAPIHANIPLYRVKYGSHRYSGNCINFVHHTEEVINELPRLPKDLDILILKAPNVSIESCSTFSVNRKRVETFCKWAKEHNLPGWNKITISEQNIK